MFSNRSRVSAPAGSRAGMCTQLSSALPFSLLPDAACLEVKCHRWAPTGLVWQAWSLFWLAEPSQAPDTLSQGLAALWVSGGFSGAQPWASQTLRRAPGRGPSTAGQPLSSPVVCDPAIQSWLWVGTYHSSTTTQSAPCCLEAKPRAAQASGCPAPSPAAPALCLPAPWQLAQPAWLRGVPEPRNSRAGHPPWATKGDSLIKGARENKAVTTAHHGAGSQNNTGPVACQLWVPPGAPGLGEKHIVGQLAAPDQTWEMQVSAGWLHMSCHSAGRCQPWWEHCRGRREDGKKRLGHDCSAWREDVVWPLHAINLFPDLRWWQADTVFEVIL